MENVPDAIARDLAKQTDASPNAPSQFDPRQLRSCASFDIRTKSGAKLLFSAQFGDFKQLESMVGKSILVSDYYAHDVEDTDDNGEIKTWTRIVVFDNDGTPYQCGSVGVGKSLATMSQIRGKGSFNPPIKCSVMTKRTAEKNLFMWLQPDVDDMLAGLPG